MGMCFLYFIQAEEQGPIKIGIAKNVENRLKSLQSSNPEKLKVLKKFKLSSRDKAKELELRFHRFFRHTRIIGEWFRYKPFSVRYIKDLFLEEDEIYTKSRTVEDVFFNLDIYKKFSEIDHSIQIFLGNLIKDGDYHSVEYIIEEIKESVKNSTGIKLK